jgi:ubiquitin-conjugating enzyme E2 J2
MIESNPTLGSIETTTRKKKQLAAQSLQWNVEQNPPFVKLFPEYVERYEEEKRTRPPKEPESSKGGTSSSSSAIPPGAAAVVALPPSIATLIAGLVAILSIVLVYRFT